MVQENVCKTIIQDTRGQKIVKRLLNKKNVKVKDYILLKY